MAGLNVTHPITRIAVYTRVSTLAQNSDLQLDELRAFAVARGWAIANEYIDEGVSGSRECRPALNQLMQDAHRRKFDAVLCWKLDRFGRSLKHLVNALADLEALGIAFISLRDSLDLSTPSGRLMFQIIGAMAEFERLFRNACGPGCAMQRQKASASGARECMWT